MKANISEQFPFYIPQYQNKEIKTSTKHFLNTVCKTQNTIWYLYIYTMKHSGWGLLKLRSLISPLGEILIQQQYRLNTFNHVHICQVTLQISCGDTCQIWTWCNKVNSVLIILKFGKITERINWLSESHKKIKSNRPWYCRKILIWKLQK